MEGRYTKFGAGATSVDVWASPLEPTGLTYAPHAYQLAAIDRVVNQACAGLFLDPGLGKTSIMLAAFQLLREKGLVKKALVIAPLRPAYAVWPAEVRKWLDFQDINIQVLHGQNKSAVHDPHVDIHVVNPEGLGWLLGDGRTVWTDRRRAAMHGSSWWWDMLIVDESTRFKHTNTQRYKFLRPWLDRFARRYILTGSPAPNGLLDLFGQIYLLDGGAALGRYITRYRTDFFNPTGFGGYTWVPKAGAEEAIYQRISPLVMRLSAEDYTKLPPLIENVVKVPLPPEAATVYRQMETLLVAQLAAKTVTAANAASAVMKCRQLANGGIFEDGSPFDDSGPRKFTHVHQAKTSAAAELVEELAGQPALIAYEFLHDLARLKEAFPDAPHLGGGVSMKEQERIIGLWNAGLLPVLLVQPQSAAHGLNLQGTGGAVIFYGLTWDLENRDQLIRRLWRQGQTKPVMVHYLVAVDTVDEVIMQAIAQKEKVQTNLLDALDTYLGDKYFYEDPADAS